MLPYVGIGQTIYEERLREAAESHRIARYAKLQRKQISNLPTRLINFVRRRLWQA
ncbi:MAG: hypothetical protein M1396_04405 [Chloroflexi bacterium]|nr:hypothetical protein [Chloroflexota bacterium]MCL5946801.1 hypothetical protein [Chloroflexota bacterium]